MSNEKRRYGAEGDEMRKTIARHSRADLEQLLDGQPARPDALAEFLTAARTSPGVVDVAGWQPLRASRSHPPELTPQLTGDNQC
jgi:hypothetical protein